MKKDELEQKLGNIFGFSPTCNGEEISLALIGERHFVEQYELVQEAVINALRPSDFMNERYNVDRGTYKPSTREFHDSSTGQVNLFNRRSIFKKRFINKSIMINLAHKYNMNVSGYEKINEDIPKIFDKIKKEDSNFDFDFFDSRVDIEREKLMGPRIVQLVKDSKGLTLGVMGASHMRPDSKILTDLRQNGIGYALYDQTGIHYPNK